MQNIGSSSYEKAYSSTRADADTLDDVQILDQVRVWTFVLTRPSTRKRSAMYSGAVIDALTDVLIDRGHFRDMWP